MGRYITTEDYRRRARRRLPRSIFDFVDGGAGDEFTVRANRQAFHRFTFRTRPLVDVSVRDQSLTIFGRRVETPVLLGPAGSTRLVHRDGECAVARAAARAGTIYALSAGSNFTLEEVADAGQGATLWFQIYLWKDRAVVADLARRAERAGYHALCVTVDTPLSGLKDRDLRNGLTIPPRLTARNAVDTCRHVRWMKDFVLRNRITFKNLEAYDFDMGGGVMGLATFMQQKLNNPANTWDDVRWLRDQWDGPLVVKGLLSGDAAARAFDVGADGVLCSNHGGRQLAGNPATLDVLPELADVAAARGKELFLDGGVRRGTDVLKAVALGATACFIARPYHWALAVAGEDGIVALLQLLHREIDNALAQLGRPRLDDLDRSALRPALPSAEADMLPAELRAALEVL